MEAQRDRLLDQLKDLEDLREDMEEGEYETERKNTIDQLKEFEADLEKMAKGDMTLQSELDATRAAVRAAISEAFKTPDVIRMFAKKETPELRRRLAEIDRDIKLGKLDEAIGGPQAVEILVALKRLGDQILPKEEAFLQAHMSQSMAEFEAVKDTDDVKSFPASGAGSGSS